MWMMLVQIVCSLPLTVTYTLIQARLGGLHYLDDINSISILLTALNFLIDPLMYWYFFQDLRRETIQLLRGCLGIFTVIDHVA